MSIVLDGEANLQHIIDGELNLQFDADGEVGIYTRIMEYENPVYAGPTEVTPSTVLQVLGTKDKSVVSNIIINPIPNNYGLITWDGRVLTVS